MRVAVRLRNPRLEASMSVTAALLMLASYLASAISAYSILQFAAGPNPSLHSRVRVAVISLGMGPLFIASILTTLLFLAPGLSPSIIVASVLTILLVCVLVGVSLHTAAFHRVLSITAGHLLSVRSREPVSVVGAVVLALIVLLVLVPAIAVPLAGNDALEYAGAAKRVFLERSTAGYPFINPTSADGFYGPWSHPLGYVGLQVWGFLIQGSATEAGVIKLITPYFAFCTALAVIHGIGGARRLLAPWAAALLLATPAYFFTTMQTHVDQIRMFPLIAAFLALPFVALPTSRWRGAVLLGCILGAGLFVHSIGVLSLLLLGFVLFVALKIPVRKRFALVAGMMFIALFLNASRLAVNVSLYNSPIADVESVPVFGISELEWGSFLRETRGIASTSDRWIFGVLAGLTRPDLFGVTYWFFVAAIIVFLRHRLRRVNGQPPPSLAGVVTSRLQEGWSTLGLLLAVLVFEAMIAFSVVVGVDTFIKNYRYLMTTLPLAIVFSSRELSPWVAARLAVIRDRGRSLQMAGLWLAILAGVFITVSPVGYFSYSRLRLFELQHSTNLFLPESAKLRLSRLGQMQMLGVEPWLGIADVRVLTLRQAEFAFYAKVPYVVDLDPRLEPFYKTQDPDAAFRMLRSLDITHVSVPPEITPTLYNSALQDIVNSGRYVQRRDYFGKTKLVQLRNRIEPPRPNVSVERVFKSEWAIPEDGLDTAHSDPSSIRTSKGWTIRVDPFLAWRIQEGKLISDRFPIEHGSTSADGVLRAGEEYQLTLDLEGNGEVSIDLSYEGADHPIASSKVWHGVLDGRPRRVRAHFTMDVASAGCGNCQTFAARMEIKLVSRGEVHVGSLAVTEAGYVATPACGLRDVAVWSAEALRTVNSRVSGCGVSD